MRISWALSSPMRRYRIGWMVRMTKRPRGSSSSSARVVQHPEAESALSIPRYPDCTEEAPMHEEEQLNEAQRETPPEEQQPVPLAQSLGFGAGTFLAAGMVDLLAHLGPTGLVVGGIAAYVASRHGPELYAQVRGALPPSLAREPSRQPRYAPGQRGERTSKRSILDRALGRFPEEDEEHEDETVIVDEDEEE